MSLFMHQAEIVIGLRKATARAELKHWVHA